MSAATPPVDPKDPWKNFPGGNPFGPNGPFGPGGPFAGMPFPGGPGGPGGDPTANMEAWFRSMGIDPTDFRRLVEQMQKDLQDAFKGLGADPSKSFVSGFSVRVGPDGKPTFSSFGNKPSVKAPAPGQALPAVSADEREPLTDVIEEGDHVAITMELPGVEKKDIQLHMTSDQLEITVDNERRKYHKRVKLPSAVEPNTTQATYNNGILDVTVKRKGGPSGMRIPVS